MATRKQSHDQQTVQEDAIVQELLAEVQAIEERGQCAVRLHQLMNQRCHLEIPVQYERLFLHSPAGKEENKDDYRRSTEQSHRRRIPHQRV